MCGFSGIMDLISNLTSKVINRALDGLSMRHVAISSNLANVDTPNYRRRDVAFEDSLKSAINNQASGGQPMRVASNDQQLGLRLTQPGHIPLDGQSATVEQVQPDMTESEGVAFRNDGNAVDVESEMAHLAENTQRYIALTNINSRMGRSIRSVIQNSGG